MHELSEEASVDIVEWLDYYAYDKFDDDKKECSDIIESIYGNSEIRYFNNETKLLSDLESNSFNAIILVNVLHEISPLQWGDLFATESLSCNLLNSNGKLIIVENQIIPNGEKAYTEGFIVFDVPEFKKLFGLSKYYFTETSEGRLKSHVFNKSDIERYSADNLKDALKSLFYRSKREVEDVRDKKTTYKNGMIHGFWVQQLANVFLILNKMGIKIE